VRADGPRGTQCVSVDLRLRLGSPLRQDGRGHGSRRAAFWDSPGPPHSLAGADRTTTLVGISG